MKEFDRNPVEQITVLDTKINEILTKYRNVKDKYPYDILMLRTCQSSTLVHLSPWPSCRT